MTYRTTELLEILDDMKATFEWGDDGQQGRFVGGVDEDLLPELAYLFHRGGLDPDNVYHWQLLTILLSHFALIGKSGPKGIWQHRGRLLLQVVYEEKVVNDDSRLIDVLERVTNNREEFQREDPRSLVPRYYEAMRSLRAIVANGEGSEHESELLRELSKRGKQGLNDSQITESDHRIL